MKNYCRRPLKIHVWGGLGSQLYAWVLAHSIKNSSRDLQLIFHTGGVTERMPEIIPLLENLASFQVIHDFKQTKNLKYSKKVPTLVRGLLAKLARATGVSVNLVESRSQIKPWTLEIRGHYRNIFLPKESLFELITQLKRVGALRISLLEHTTALHYRLGDIIGLKPTIPPEDLENVIQMSKEIDPSNSIKVFSDSLDLAEKLLTNIEASYDLLFTESGIWKTISDCVNAKCFIGTNSKISYWVVYLRLSLDSGSRIFMPKNFESDLINSIGPIINFPNLRFY